MKRAIPAALAALIPLLWAACASSSGGAVQAAAPPVGGGSAAVQLTRVGEAVQITEDAESTHECEFITDLPLTGTSIRDANAMRALRNEAGRQGANLVLVVMASQTLIERAEGYLCAD